MRPTKLTPEIVDNIKSFSQIGMTWPDLATFCGVGISTIKRWRKIGERESERRIKGFEPNESRQVFLDFWTATKRARLSSKYACVQTIYNVAMGDPGDPKKEIKPTRPNWFACAWLLERLYPDEFALASRTKLAELAEQVKLLKK